MFGIGMPELIIILVIILIIFGVGKLPEIGGGMGKAIRNFKDASNKAESDAPESWKRIKKPDLQCAVFFKNRFNRAGRVPNPSGPVFISPREVCFV
jgi:sec-independent protein translocase protein TatA